MATDLGAAQLFANVACGSDMAKPPGLVLEQGRSAAGAGPLMEWRGFHTELQKAAIAATQTGAPLSLLMLELVGSGRNGEPRGAEITALLTAGLAGRVKAAVGARACLARYAEARLAVILIDTDLDAAIGHAEGIARRLCAHRGGAARGVGPELSPAIGIAQFRDDESLGHLIQRTAAALGRARRDRGVVADSGKERPGCPGCGTIAHRLCLPPMPSMAAAGGEEPMA
ncbi:MAG: diguanylate cyclase domain-containing protein [Geminicoccaceae bacterium]